MKKLIVLMFVLLVSGCTTKTEFGPCIGVADDKDPHLVYRISKWNVFMAIIGFQFIYPPIAVLVDSTFCPEGRK